MSSAADAIRVQVCYARADQIFLEEVGMPPEATLEQVIHASGVLVRYPEIDLAACTVGIYGKIKPLDTILRSNDRIEIYRSLLADPKEARRRRVAKKEKAR
jgi:hypothetical protein